jgi:hypothetical protein
METRELNYIALEEIIESGVPPLDLLKQLVRTMGATEVNDHFAYICRMGEIEIPCGEELAKYEDRS